MCESVLACRETVSCSECVQRVEEQQRRGQWMNIHVRHLQPNIVLFQDFNDPLSELKARMINKDINLKFNVFLIIDTLLIINDLRYEFKNKLISAVCWNGEKVIYVNNNSFSKTFSKFIINYIFKINCDFWVHSFAVWKPSLKKNKKRH